MNILKNPHNHMIALGAIVLMSTATIGYSYYSADAPSVQQQGNVTYVTGGISDEERKALENMGSDYNLHVTSAGKNGAFTGDIQLAIYDQSGNEIIATEAGPLFYAALPAGKYTIAAENEGMKQQRTVKISDANNATINLAWK